MSTPTRPPTTRALALLVVGVVGLLGVAGPAQADSSAPQLSIRVDDGQAEARSGTTLRYAVTVTNLGGTRLRDLAVSQTVPPKTTPGPVSDHGTTTKGVTRWTVDVPAGKSLTLTTSVEVGKDLPPELLRLASVACASATPGAAPLVCASDSDELPAGAVAADQRRQGEPAAAAATRPWRLPSGIGLVGLLVLGVPAVLIGRARRHGAVSTRRKVVPNSRA